MRNLWIVLLVVAALIGVLFVLPQPDEAPAPAADGTTASADHASRFAITDVRLFDGERVIENAAVIVADGRVVAAGPLITTPIPDGAERIDGAGKTLLPGLIDAHVHAFGGAQEDAVRFGVTTLLDMFRAPLDFDAQHAQRASRDPIASADLYSAGYLATAAGGHGTQYGIEVPIPDGPAGAQPWVDDRLAEGSDWIKIVVEDGRGWGSEIPSLAGETVAAIVEAAHARGVLAVAHVGSLAEAELAVAAGADGLVHLFGDAEVPPETAADWAARGLFIVPTTPVLAGAYGQAGIDRLARYDLLEPMLSAEQRRSLGGSFPNSALRAHMWPVVQASIRTLNDAGVALLAGSDAPNPGTANGISLLDAVIRLHEAGLTEIDALRAASGTPASVFTMLEDDDPRGCVRAGCRADLMLVYGNPFDDINDLLRIDTVWKNGATVERELPPAPEAAPMGAPAAGTDLLENLAQWMPSADDFMGGASDASIEMLDTGLSVTGTLRPGFAFPYAGGLWSPGDVPMMAVDRRGWTTLRLSVSGDVEQLRIMFFSNSSPQPVWLDMPPGDDIVIDLEDLAGLELAAFQGLGVFASGPAAPFDFVIEAARFE